MPWRNGSVYWLLTLVPKEEGPLPPWNPALSCYWAWKIGILTIQKDSRRDKQYPVEMCCIELNWNLNFIICSSQENIWDTWFAVTADNNILSGNLSQGSYYKNDTIKVGVLLFFFFKVDYGLIQLYTFTVTYFCMCSGMQVMIIETESNLQWKGPLEISGSIPSQSRTSFKIILACSGPSFSHYKHFW